MSKGPGTVERAIRELLAARRERDDGFTLGTEALCEAAFGATEPTKAQRVSALRAMHRIMATETGWTTTRSHRGYVLMFFWRRRGSGLRLAKPGEVHEPILVWDRDAHRLAEDQAVIVTRSSRSYGRVTIAYDGRKYQGHELEDGRILCRQMYGQPPFCHERARAKVEAEHAQYDRALDRFASPGAPPPTPLP